MTPLWIQVLLFSCLSVVLVESIGPYNWMGPDAFDDINDRMDAVDRENCFSKPEAELYLPEDALGSQMPQFNKLLTTVIYPNRTNLLHVHNMALNRAFFYSYAFQRLNESEQFQYQPGLLYYYFSAAADVSANEYSINGSAIFFDNNCSYATWYNNLKFNDTLPLFGPRAWRFDDYNDPTNWLREPTNNTIDIIDYGAGTQSNYSHDSYKINQWYRKWLPDDLGMKGKDSVRKHPYDVGIKYSNETGKFVDDEFQGTVFFGPPSPGIRETVNLPVVWTQPYFDCGRSNKWIVSAVAPVLDQLPRYLDWFHLRRHRFVAASTMDIDFLSIDFNPCPIGLGNEEPNYFAGTTRCKPSTMCEPLYGWGFRRGGYQCVCRSGKRYPPWQHGPYKGIDVESATGEEYKNGFDCLDVELQMVLPIIRNNETGTPEYNPILRKKREVEQTQLIEETDGENEKDKDVAFFGTKARHIGGKDHEPNRLRILKKKLEYYRILGLKEKKHQKAKVSPRQKVKVSPRHPSPFETETVKMTKKTTFLPRYKRDDAHVRVKRQAFDTTAFDRMVTIISHKERVTKDNCHKLRREELYLPGDVSYNVEKQFAYQARTALRLSHFLSNFMQNVDAAEEYGNLLGDNLLNTELIYGEALANVMGDLRIKGSGVFFDTDKFKGPDERTRQYFGPYAFRYEEADLTGGPKNDIANTNFRAIDFAGFPKHYLDKPWFKFVKERWQSNTYGLTKYTEKPMIRSDLVGTSLRRFEMYPMYYYAPSEEDGWWSAPHFDCEGNLKDWIITYAVPFFGLNSIRSALEFKGVVTVDIKLDEMDVNQCPMEFYVPNAFKSTARCDYTSTYCEALPGLAFVKGGYKCECLDGYEYPFNDPRAWYFDGQTMEEEYRKKVMGLSNRFDTLKCRIAGAGRAAHSWMIVLLSFIVATILHAT